MDGPKSKSVRCKRLNDEHVSKEESLANSQREQAQRQQRIKEQLGNAMREGRDQDQMHQLQLLLAETRLVV